MFKPKPVVFNIFQVATHFETQFDLSTSFRNFPVRHMKCSCVCTKKLCLHNRKSLWLKNNVRYHYA